MKANNITKKTKRSATTGRSHRRKTPRDSARDPFYIVSQAPHVTESTRVLKHGEIFGVFNQAGNIEADASGEQGLYFQGTRFLSRYVFALCDHRPLHLSSTVKNDNALFAIDLTNPDLPAQDNAIKRGTVHIGRNIFLWQGEVFEQLQLRSYGETPIRLSFSYFFAADFADIFEVRGTPRAKRGRPPRATVDDDTVTVRYRGLDSVVRETRLRFSLAPASLDGSMACFELTLAPGEQVSLQVVVSCIIHHEVPRHLGYDDALMLLGHEIAQLREQSCQISSSNLQFNEWLERSLTDIDMMVTETPQGPFPFAGVPWFSTPFGRDGIITALELLWVNPSIAAGVLKFLAATQAHVVDAEKDAEPGKIVHEMRKGEMAALGEIPFGRYYGSVDATPLFLMLASAYYERTADRALIESIWPNLELALKWIDQYGDTDGDGFVEYARRSPDGLVQQGWKDSQDSIFHADGSLAAPPIALCEVQGYAYAARLGAARLAAMLGRHEQSARLLELAEKLKSQFDRAFWCDELATYAIALDGDKRPCRVRSSNAGHALMTGIAAPSRAPLVARTLMDEQSCSGWGIRTIAQGEARYNPMSYHNGSVWPHDNALVAYGLDRYRLKEASARLLAGMFNASKSFDLHRMPELFCGFGARDGCGPTLYPVACSPQSWAAASVFLLLQSCLGLHIHGPERVIRIAYPCLPDGLEELQLRNLKIGPASVDLLLKRHGNDVGVNVLRRTGDIEVVAVK